MSLLTDKTLDLIAKAGKRLVPDGVLSQEQIEGVEKLLPAALQRLGQSVSDDADIGTRALLQTYFELTLSGGDAALRPSMVADAMGAAVVTLNTVAEPLQYLPHYQDLLNPPPIPDYTFYTIHENKVKVRDYTGAAGTASALRVYCNYIPDITQVPDSLIDDLLDIIIELYTEAMKMEAGMEAATAKSPVK